MAFDRLGNKGHGLDRAQLAAGKIPRQIERPAKLGPFAKFAARRHQLEDHDRPARFARQFDDRPLDGPLHLGIDRAGDRQRNADQSTGRPGRLRHRRRLGFRLGRRVSARWSGDAGFASADAGSAPAGASAGSALAASAAALRSAGAQVRADRTAASGSSPARPSDSCQGENAAKPQAIAKAIAGTRRQIPGRCVRNVTKRSTTRLPPAENAAGTGRSPHVESARARLESLSLQTRLERSGTPRHLHCTKA